MLNDLPILSSSSRGVYLHNGRYVAAPGQAPGKWYCGEPGTKIRFMRCGWHDSYILGRRLNLVRVEMFDATKAAWRAWNIARLRHRISALECGILLLQIRIEQFQAKLKKAEAAKGEPDA